MLISITSNNIIEKVYLKDLSNVQHNIKLGKDQPLDSGRYVLCVEYVDTSIEIEDISINGSSIGQFIYTGYCTDSQGQIHQPATAVWDKGCCFSIWIHTDIGQMIERLYEEIDNGEYGKNLFEKYVLTVNRPHKIHEGWDNKMISFFNHGDGPHWWKNNHDDAPWLKLKLPKIDVDQLLLDLDKFCTNHSYCKAGGPWGFDSGVVRNNKLTDEQDYGLLIKQLKNGVSDLPFVEIDDIPYQSIKDLVIASGYKRLIDISVQTLKPGHGFMIHRDDHTQRECYPYIKGCKKVYWAIKGSDDVQFKLGRSGLLPLEHPLMVNTADIPHSVIHEGNEPRTSILIYGELA